jgi:uncharacterized protein
MFIQTKDLAGEALPVDISFPRPPMEGTGGAGEPVRLRGTLTRQGRGFRLAGRVSSRLLLDCARCGAPFPFAVEADFDLLVRGRASEPPAAHVAVNLTSEDCREVELDEEGRIDAVSLAKEEIYLTIPMKPVCDESCRGICPSCGADRNRETCACTEAPGDARWAALAEMKSRRG